jgi:hypothetical protein
MIKIKKKTIKNWLVKIVVILIVATMLLTGFIYFFSII